MIERFSVAGAWMLERRRRRRTMEGSLLCFAFYTPREDGYGMNKGTPAESSPDAGRCSVNKHGSFRIKGEFD